MLKSKLKRWLSAAVSAVMICGMAGLLPNVLNDDYSFGLTAEAAGGASIEDEMNKYPHFKFWNHVGGKNNPDGYSNSPCTHHGNCNYNVDNGCDCNRFDGAIQCYGFALKVAYDIYGESARYWKKDKDISKLKAGDLCRINGDDGTGNKGHSIIIIKVDGENVSYGDCNGTGIINNGRESNTPERSCRINWKRTTTKTALLGKMTGAGDGVSHAPYEAPWIHSDPTPIGHEMDESEAAGQTIPDGVYHIMSAADQHYGLAVGGSANTANGANAFLWNFGELQGVIPTDTWKITYLNNGFYRIQQNGVNVSLDISGGDLHRGANIQAWENNDSSAQQWSILPTYSGYRIQSRCNSFILDLADAKTENETNIQIWEDNGSIAQRWCLIPYQSAPPIEEGFYRIHSEIDDGFVLDAAGNLGEYANESNIQVWDSSGDDVFVLEYADNGYYYIKEPVSGLYVDVWNGNGGADYANWGTNIQLFGKTDSRGRLWSVQNMHGNTYTLISKLNGYALDLENGKCVNGQNVSLHTLNSPTASPAQRWVFEPVELKSIRVDQKPDKTTYIVNEKLNPAGIIVNAVYSGNYSFKIAKGLTYDYDFSTTGEKTVKVSYKINGKTLTDSFKVTVSDISLKGSGTKANPYLIETKSDLEQMRNLVNSEDYASAFKSCYYLQTADIDLNNEKWTPIGKAFANGEQNTMHFTGHYDGGKHWIHGLNVDEDTKFAGLFGCVNSGTVENLAVEGNVSGDDLSVGGIVGEVQNATVSDCCFIGDVTGNGAGVGGIVGYLWQRGTVQNCYHIGTVKTSDTHSAGGVVGRIQSNEVKSAVCTVENCYHVGKMDSTQKNYGTIVGYIDKAATDVGQKIHLKNCYGLSSDGALYAGDKPDTNTAQAVKESVLKLMAPTLGDSFVKNSDSKYLEGYPVFPWQTRLAGDVNADGVLDIADAVLIHKWLSTIPDTELADWEAGDMNEDGKLDVRDLSLMKQALLNP